MNVETQNPKTERERCARGLACLIARCLSLLLSLSLSLSDLSLFSFYETEEKKANPERLLLFRSLPYSMTISIENKH